jgi:hypothetical protein
MGLNTSVQQFVEMLNVASALNLSIGYYHIKLYADAQKICTIVFSWNTGK